jgi:hypothetical protein
MSGEGMEFVQFENVSTLAYGTAFHVVITYAADNSTKPPANLIKTVFYGDGFPINEYQTNSSTSYGHTNAAGAESVGAASFLETPEWGMSPPILEPFSSAGGTPILFDKMGMRLVVPEVRLKPEIIAVDGVNTTFFFEDLIGDMELDFFGTSAAAAHAAGVAALMLEEKPMATPEQIKTDLESTTLDMGVPGFDHDSGFGLIQAELALAAGGPDADLDGVPDSVDNCIDVPNGPFIPDSGGHGLPQWDTDGDGYGNMCDADFTQDGNVNGFDLGYFKSVFFSSDPDGDLNGDGSVNGFDLGIFKGLFFKPPGPSGLAP